MSHLDTFLTVRENQTVEIPPAGFQRGTHEVER